MGKYRQAARVDENQAFRSGLQKVACCKYCSNDFFHCNRPSRPPKYCSTECQNQAHSERMSGSGNINYKGVMDELRVCPTCGEKFKPVNAKSKYCSRSCLGSRPDNIERLKVIAPIAAAISNSTQQPRPKLGRKNTCKTCSKVFRDIHKRTYCDDHIGHVNGKPPMQKKAKCSICGSDFERQYAGNARRTCSDFCRSKQLAKRQKGAKSHRWQGGKTTDAMIIRGSFEYKSWRVAVFERDGYQCQICGQVGGKLNADHIKPFSTHPELRLNIDNGRTLCIGCHRQTETYGIKALRAANE
ncbi:MAG: hypothetical protein CL578_22485 [Alteromonadaceae bacterium]|uniref:HNH endonuclease n=1 Tax=unclassified Methylophaga TaxID=2629249 RepID=UPI000C56804F|nr:MULTISPECIES: HNH endonuclease [unclassified Methylophaga]MAP27769.1 hypothetical protein [Methylophaga sp.]MBN27796.1 hypothetical protein [Alteromonadaceae bacterium]HAD31544.1 hypothetical protein [Methylophaga sp.]HBX59839.1 hypothetical protein [Methylophaga sp.]